MRRIVTRESVHSLSNHTRSCMNARSDTSSAPPPTHRTQPHTHKRIRSHVLSRTHIYTRTHSQPTYKKAVDCNAGWLTLGWLGYLGVLRVEERSTPLHILLSDPPQTLSSHPHPHGLAASLENSTHRLCGSAGSDDGKNYVIARGYITKNTWKNRIYGESLDCALCGMLARLR